MSLKDDVKERLLQSVETMQDAVDTAKRAIKEMDDAKFVRSPISAIARVQHAFMWGSANAWSQTENALARVEHYGERQRDVTQLLIEAVREIPGGSDTLGEYDRRRG